jgi:very-short-patch-repair endonuclease
MAMGKKRERKTRTTISLPPEQELYEQLKHASLELPSPQHTFAQEIGRNWAFDYAYVDRRIAIEVEGGTRLKGGGRHNRHTGFQEDVWKYNTATKLGWRLYRFTSEDVYRGRALEFLKEILK